MTVEEIVRFLESHAAMCEAHGFEEEEVKALQLASKLFRAGQAMRDAFEITLEPHPEKYFTQHVEVQKTNLILAGEAWDAAMKGDEE